MDDNSNYQSAVLKPIKFLLHVNTTPLKIITRHLQNHQSHPVTAINLNPDLNAEADPKPHSFQKDKNYITTTSDNAPKSITSGLVANSTLVNFSDTYEYLPTFISTITSDMPLEAPTSVPYYEPRDSTRD